MFEIDALSPMTPRVRVDLQNGHTIFCRRTEIGTTPKLYVVASPAPRHLRDRRVDRGELVLPGVHVLVDLDEPLLVGPVVVVDPDPVDAVAAVLDGVGGDRVAAHVVRRAHEEDAGVALLDQRRRRAPSSAPACSGASRPSSPRSPGSENWYAK
jgi:hypothetical protein